MCRQGAGNGVLNLQLYSIERLNREVKRRTNAVGSFPDGRSAMMLAAARCKYVADGNWGKRRYLDMSLLDLWDERSVSTD